MKNFLLVLLFASVGPPMLALDDHNPVGITGAFEGMITTAGAYNVLNHSATRQIDDIVVPGAIGKYGLKMTRYYNSRHGFGDGWSYEYSWSSFNGKIWYPNGNMWDNSCTGEWSLPGPLGVSDWPTTWNGHPAFRLSDGGTIVFGNAQWTSVASKIVDPYGQETDITLGTNGRITRVTEPGGRYLQYTYDGSGLLTQVDANDGQGHQVDWVVYHYTAKTPGGGHPSVQCLTSVDYSDGTHAYYTYEQDNVPEDPNSGSTKAFPLVNGCDDAHYHGPMRRIAYDYQDQGPHGAILMERYWDGVTGNEGSGVVVSTISPALVDPRVTLANFPTTFTETRGDGPISRTFTYTDLHIHRFEGDRCPTLTFGPAPQQFLQSYTDFQGHATNLGYDTNWYVNSVTDANVHTTTYVRGSAPPAGIGEILTITHPGGNHIDYTYDDHGHYVHTISNERQKITTYTRDPTTHRVTRIDYPSDANTPASYEEFTYNNFGQVLTHHLKNNAWESFVYGGRGLLLDKYNPKQGSVPGSGDPYTHYDYYTSADGKLGWIDRVKKVTLPANVSGNVASETYEYDRTLDASGITNLTGVAVEGRGLVTKITHADNTYQQFKYDAYGNKRWEDNELRQENTYTYDDYNRLLTAKNPLNKTTSYTYTPTNGGGGSSYKHTTANSDTETTPTGIVTRNVYDQNFRKTSTTAADGTALAATTWLHYDAVGNQDYVTDPRGTSTPGSYTTYTDYDTRDRKWQVRKPLGSTTQFYYDDNVNITRIVRAVGTPDVTTETKTYDAMNRVLTDNVPQTGLVSLTTTFTYNPSGTIQKIRDPKVHFTWLYYDASDRKITMTYPDNSTQQWAYDDAGNLKNRTTVGGKIQSFTYDNLNRKTQMTWSNTAEWAQFFYDDASQLREAKNGTGILGQNVIADVTRQYNAAGHLTLDQQNVTGLGIKNVSYPLYDGDGRLTRMYVAGATGYDFTYSYDEMGRFETISLTPSSLLFQYHYDAASNEIQRDSVYNGVNQVYPRDALNRIQYVDVKRGATTLNHEWYTYDAMDRITAVTYGTGSPDSFTYYLDGELNAATLGNLGHNLTYNVDKMGNRTSVVDNSVTATYSPNSINQYTSVTGSTISNGLEHEVSAFNGVTYSYINDGRLNSVTTGSTTYSMVYDALGRCVKRTLTGGPTTYYIYDGEKPILEYASAAVSVGVNVYGKGVDEIVERVAIGSDSNSYTYYPQQNHEGSVNQLTDASGSAIERYRYDAFGAPTIYTATWGVRANTIYDNRFLFIGREYAATYRSTYNTPAFTFYEYRARAYNPTLGRFMSEDPKLFDAGDYNLFRYCHNDPLDLTDPMGLEVGFGESLIPVWGSGHLAYDAFNEGHYYMAAFHTAMAVTDVSGVKALGSLAAKASFKSLAKTEIGRAIAKTTEHKAATTGYRYVGNAEANAIRETARIPIVDASGKAKNVFFTNEKFALGSEAKEGLSLTSKPQYRVEFNLNQAPAGYGGLTEANRAEFTLREGAQPIKAERIVPLDDAELLNETSRLTPPKLDK